MSTKNRIKNHNRHRLGIFRIAFRVVFYYNIGHAADFAISKATTKKKKNDQDKKYHHT